MITISELKTFLSILKMLEIDTSQEKNSVVECVRVKQISAKITEFTTQEPSSGIFNRCYVEPHKDFFGEEGDEFLISYKEFVEGLSAIDKAGESIVTLSLEKGRLLLYGGPKTVYSSNEEGEVVQSLKYKDCRSCRLYPGDLNDFTIPDMLTETIHLGQVRGEDLNLFVSLMIQFGQFSGTDEKYVNTVESAGRGILFKLAPLELNIFLHDKNLQVLLEGKLPFAESDVRTLDEFVIEGRHLKRLLDLTDKGNIIDLHLIKINEHDWIHLVGTLGSVYIRTKEEDPILYHEFDKFNKAKGLLVSDESLFPDDPESPTYKDLMSEISCNGRELIARLNGQHTEANKLQEELVIAEKNGELIVYDLAKALLEDKSCLDLEASSGDWIDISVNYKFIVPALNVLVRYITAAQVGQLIKLTQLPYIVGDDLQVVLTFLTPLHNDIDKSVEIFFVARPAADKLLEEVEDAQVQTIGDEQPPLP